MIENSTSQVQNSLVSELCASWDRLAAAGQVHYASQLLKTKILASRDASLPFFLVYNAGRRRYIESVANQKKDLSACPFCSADYAALQIGSRGSLRIMPNTFPCLPHQFVLTPAGHDSNLAAVHVKDAMEFARDTGLKTYANSPGGGSAYTHVVFQSSARHSSAPSQDFLSTLRATVFARSSHVTAACFDQDVFGVKFEWSQSSPVGALIAEIAADFAQPLNLLFSGSDVIVIPRSDIEVASGFGRWRFGVLEATGMFICQDEERFEQLSYDALEKARREVFLASDDDKRAFIDRVGAMVKS